MLYEADYYSHVTHVYIIYMYQSCKYVLVLTYLKLITVQHYESH